MQQDHDERLKASNLIDTLYLLEGAMVGDTLTASQERFCIEYMRTENGSLAYKLSYNTAPGTTPKSLSGSASHLLANPKIKARIRDLRNMIAAEALVGVKDLMLDWLDIARANPNDLVSIKISCCRHCLGTNGAYQYVDEEEYELACVAEEADAKRLSRPARPIDVTGGFGFDFTQEPNPACTKCHGEGAPRVVVKDTSDLNAQARKLYKGVKVSKGGGIEVLMHDQQRARECLARMLGAFNDKLDTGNNTAKPIPEGVSPEQAAQMYADLMK